MVLIVLALSFCVANVMAYIIKDGRVVSDGGSELLYCRLLRMWKSSRASVVFNGKLSFNRMWHMVGHAVATRVRSDRYLFYIDSLLCFVLLCLLITACYRVCLSFVCLFVLLQLKCDLFVLCLIIKQLIAWFEICV